MSWSEPVTSWPRSRRRPASDAMAVPAMADRWTFIGVLAPARSSSSASLGVNPRSAIRRASAAENALSLDRRFQDLEACLFAVAAETRADPQRQRDAGPVDVASGEAECDRYFHALQPFPDDVLQ